VQSESKLNGRVSWTVERMSGEDRSGTIVAMARAFHRDPLFDFLIPDAVSQARAALTFLGSVVADAFPFGEVWAAREGQIVIGGAAWLPPGTYPRGVRRSSVSAVRDLRGAHRLGRRFTAGARLFGAIDRAHHRVREPHWYLALLGCDPGWQRRGVGSSLLAPVLERADQTLTPAYLETQKEENVPWYRRHGFDVVTELRPPGCPTMWAMRRDPR
jgi:GNAT superfamily N-acetyltransferase